MPYRPTNPENYRDEEWLEQKYVDEKLSTSEIGEICDCSKETIRRWLNRHNIPIRSQSEATKIEWKGEEERRKKQSEWMKKVLNNSPPQNISEGEHREEVLEKMSKVKRGEKNPVWQGGPVGYYGGSWFQKRKEILERDNYTCQECGHKDESNHVHHIKPVREFDDPEDAHFDNNLVTLCRSCHAKVEPRKV